MLSPISKYIVPSFLRRMDPYLLVHHPHVWRTRGHYVVFYALIGIIFMFLAGYNYHKQTSYEFLLEKKINPKLPFYVTYLSAFFAIGVVVVLWHLVQKFKYNRSKFTHILTEISIYSICIFLLWSATFAFLLGYEYQKAYPLSKEIEKNYVWLNDNYFFQPIYLPHYQENKLNNLNTYFKNGDYLFKQYQLRREKLQIQSTSKQEQEVDKDNDYYSYKYHYLNFIEYLTPANLEYQLPKKDTIASDYCNRFLKEHTTARDSEMFSNWTRNALPALSAPVYEELINHIDSNHYLKINISESYFYFLHLMFKKWSYQKVFLETLSNEQLQLYFNYLKYLRYDYFHLEDNRNTDHPVYFIYRSEMPLQETHVFELFAAQFPGRLRSKIGLEPNQDTSKPKEGDAGTKKTFLFLQSLSENQKKIYAQYVMQRYKNIYFEESYSDYDIYKVAKLNYGKAYIQKAHLRDSIQYFDVFFAHYNYANLTPIFTNEFCKYFVGKYDSVDFKRLDKLLTVHGFANEYTHLSASHQNLLRLLQAKPLETALKKRSKENLIFKFKYSYTFLFNSFTLSCFILVSILFYIMTISNGLEIGNSIFIGVTYFLGLYFIQRELIIIKILFCFQGFLFIRLVLGLLFLKYQWQNVRQMTNIILFSGIFYMGLAISWLKDYLYIIRPSLHSTDVLTALQNHFFIATIVVSIAIIIYLIIAYLLKRHLTLPKKY